MKVDIMNTDKKYEVIYADPPWSYRQQGSKEAVRGMARQHYSTMSTEDICKLPVRKLGTDSAILFMWATFPNMGDALKVISYLSAGGRGKYIQPGNTKGIMLKEKYIPGKHFLENGMRQAEPRLKTIGESFMQQIGREIEGGG